MQKKPNFDSGALNAIICENNKNNGGCFQICNDIDNSIITGLFQRKEKESISSYVSFAMAVT